MFYFVFISLDHHYYITLEVFSRKNVGYLSEL